jgi:acyl-[acyl-carrier-protein]-phospholipid O-acyltransferase / long-chain-fatty-acid--[acyl-carrier-protein] ligase
LDKLSAERVILGEAMKRPLLRGIVRGISKLLFRVCVQGDLSAFRAPRLLVVANHESFLDGLLL